MKWWQKLLLNTIVFLVLANFLDGFSVDNWQSAILAAIMLSLLNSIVKPIISILAIPVTLLTLGLFSFVISGLMIWFTSYLVAGFTVSSFGQAIIVSLILSLVNAFVEKN